MKTWLAVVNYYDTVLAATGILYLSSTGFVSKPTDTPPDTVFDPVIKKAATMKRDMFGSGTTMGRSRVGFGDLIVANPDGALDGWIPHAFDGRVITIYYGDDDAAFPSGFTKLVGTMEVAEFTRDEVRLRLRDRQAELDVPFQTTKYAGDNSLPNGLEGVSDLKGKPKPICYGTPSNISPPMVNTSKLICQVSDGAIDDVTTVYEDGDGTTITQGADYPDEATLLSTAPSAGTYRVYPEGGYFRLGSAPAGVITCDPVEGADAAARTAAQIATAGVLTKKGQTSADWSASDITALDTANNDVLGFWSGLQETTPARVLDEVLGSAGAWWGYDQLGIFRTKVLVTPAAVDPVVTFRSPLMDPSTLDVQTGNLNSATIVFDLAGPLQKVPVQDPGHGIPLYRQKICHSKNYTVQTAELGSVTDAERVRLGQPHLEEFAEDLSIQTAHLLAVEQVDGSLLTSASDAASEATRRLNLRKVLRQRFEFLVGLNATTLALDLGSVVGVVNHRFGLADTFVVISVAPNPAARTIRLEVWG